MPSLLVTLFNEALGAEASFPPDCSVSLAREEDQPDYADVIDSVNRGGGRPILIRKLRETHPLGQPHQVQYDQRLWDVLTEARTFAWAQDVMTLGKTRFMTDEGAPDVWTDSDVWVEAKAVWRSKAETELLRQMLDVERRGFIVRGGRDLEPPVSGLLHKFDEKLDDAIRKWRRQTTGRLLVYFELRGIDFGVSPRQAQAAVVDWAARRAAKERVGIAIWRGGDWCSPFVTERLTS